MRRVLLVEDDDDIREALLEVLEGEGYTVVAAVNGQEGLDRLGEEPRPDVILLDLMMPVKDGAQFAAEQQRNPTIANIPVVLMSAHNNGEERARQIGASGFLKKPVDIDAVLAVVKQFAG